MHDKGSSPQMIKITSYKSNKLKNDAHSRHNAHRLPCPFEVLRNYLDRRGTYNVDTEPFFVHLDKQPVTANQFRTCLKQCLKQCLKLSGFDHESFNTHSSRIGQSCDLYKLGISVQNIMKLGRWKLNAVYKYLRNC